jgi:hypothetical protein
VTVSAWKKVFERKCLVYKGSFNDFCALLDAAALGLNKSSFRLTII